MKSSSSSASEKRSSDDAGVAKIVDAIQAGFENMQQSMNQMGQGIAGIAEQMNYPVCYNEVSDSDNDEPLPVEEATVVADNANLFSNLAKGCVNTELTGPNVTRTLAELANPLFSGKHDEAAIKTRNEKHRRPANCTFVDAPTLNKEIWGLAHSVQLATDAALREIQLDLPKTVFPIVRAMDTLYKEKDSLASANFDPIEMIKNLGGAVAMQI